MKQVVGLIALATWGAVGGGAAQSNEPPAAIDVRSVPAAASADVVVSDSAWAARQLRVPARTRLTFVFDSTVNSKTAKVGEEFAIRLRDPVMVEGKVVLPAGTPGRGEVIHAARARAGGKAGELILAARYLEHGGVRIPLRSFRMGEQGDDRTETGIIVAVLAGPFAYLVVGGELNIVPGTVGNARIAADVDVPTAQP